MTNQKPKKNYAKTLSAKNTTLMKEIELVKQQETWITTLERN